MHVTYASCPAARHCSAASLRKARHFFVCHLSALPSTVLNARIHAYPFAAELRMAAIDMSRTAAQLLVTKANAEQMAGEQ